MQVIEYSLLQGIADEVILSMRDTIAPHISVEETLASRTHEGITLPVYGGQTISSH